MIDFYSLIGNLGKEERSFDINAYGDDNGIYVLAALPGVKKEEVNISYDNEVLTISVNRKQNIGSKVDNKFYAKEIKSIGGERKIIIHNVDASRISAKFEDGMLKIYAPFEKAPKKTIIIK